MHRFFDWLMLLLYVAVLFLLVRPGSQGPKLAETFSNGIVSMMNAATGGGGWSGNK
jgi:hypothetical protein